MNGYFRGRALDEARLEPDSTKARILDAAAQLFAREGFKGTTTRDIADRAGVNIAQVHYHWGSKEELWNAVLFSVIAQGFERSVALLAESGDEMPKSPESLRKVIRGLFDFMADNPNGALLLQQGRERGSESEAARDFASRLLDAYAQFIDDATPLDFSPVDTRLALFCFFGMLAFFFTNPELVKALFNEDIENLSDEFRGTVSDAMWTIAARLGGLESAKKKSRGAAR